MNNRLENQFFGFLNTPALWKNKDLFGLTQFQLPNVEMPEDLKLASQVPALATNFVLGKRIESFFEYVIKLSENYETLAANLQIYREKITLGEIDFLLKDKRKNQVLHIEVVYKFYVYDPSFENELERWIGPNRKDSLLQKISKLKEGQLPLIFKSETAEALKPYKIDSKLMEQRVCFKASLFLPFSLRDREFPNVNKDCICGYWITFSEFNSENYTTKSFYAPKKQDWPVDPKFQEEWLTFDEISMVILDLFRQKKSPLIWMKDSEENYLKFFVVWW